MRLTTTLAAAAAISLSAVAAQAGNPSAVGTTDVMIAPPAEMVDVAPTSSINSGYIVLGLVAALVAASGSF